MECKNLDVIVLTYNRAEYLRVMLESLCTQTAQGFNIKVLNNCSTDNTLEVVEEVKNKYPQRNIQVITNEVNLGNTGNFKRSQEIAENEYTAIFHDDDAIHPEYINFAMQLFNTHPNAVMCSGHLHAGWNITNNDWWGIIDKKYQIYSSRKSALMNILLGRPCFASNVYRTSAYKKIEYHPEKYGKLHDLVFQMDINQLGEVLFIENQVIKYRYHAQADSFDLKTGPFPDEILNILERTNALLNKTNLLTKTLLYWWAYHLHCYFLLKEHISFDNFVRKMIERKILTEFDLKIIKNKIAIKFIKNSIESMKKRYRRKISKKFTTRF